MLFYRDENGVNSTDFIKTPQFIEDVHDRELNFVKSWLDDYYETLLF